MYLYYGFGFLTLDHNYLCSLNGTETLEPCPVSTVCSNLQTPGFVFRVDQSVSNFVINWQQEMDLMCFDRSKINLMVTAYVIGFGTAGLLFFRLPDKWGRKKTMGVFGTIHILSQCVITFLPSFPVRMCGFLVMGACQFKNSTCYVW